MAFHSEGVGNKKPPAQNRSEKESRVREGRAHAALVYDGAECVGWCQFGSPDELPRIKRKRAYNDGQGPLLVENETGCAQQPPTRLPEVVAVS
jgi:hypothetical protein